MHYALASLIVTSAMAAAALSFAQPVDGPSAVLFDQPNLQGGSVTVVQGSSNLDARGFAGRAMSGHFDGEWTLCDRPDFSGRCQTVSGDVSDLGELGLALHVVSLRAGESSQASAAAGPEEAAANGDVAVGVLQGQGDEGGQGPYSEQEAYRGPVASQEPVASAGQGGANPVSVSPQADHSSQPPGAYFEPRPDPDRAVNGYSVIFFPRPNHAGANLQGQSRAAADGFCRDQGLGPALYYDESNGALSDLLCRRN
jgi:hypothetical protein